MTDSIHRDKIFYCNHHNPFEYLGIHYLENKSVIRAFDPHAINVSITLLKENNTLPLKKIDNRGFFEIILNRKIEPQDYKFKIKFQYTTIYTFDAYSFPPSISDYDVYLFNQGTNRFIYKQLGAHVTKLNNVKGVSFAVWAPNAVGVSVVGSFNGWDGKKHQMRVLNESGIWEIFLPHLKEYELYKFEIRTKNNQILLKSDPYGVYFEERPKTASIVFDINKKFKWNDETWLENRFRFNGFNAPVSIYELHLGSWKKGLNYREIADELAEYIQKTGFTHIEILPVMEHPLDESWGYQVTGYFAPTSRFGTPEDFKYFIDTMHKNHIGVILDWVPAHFPTDEHGLAYFDGTHLYEHASPFKGYHPDWNTYIFNYGRNEVKNFLISNAIYWFKEFHVDGLRIDAVASMLYLDYSRKPGEWEPNIYGGNENLEAINFLKELNSVCYSMFDGIMLIAEESTAWPMVTKPVHIGGLGFGYKWNMGWMNDTLNYFKLDPIYRKFHHNNITFSIWYAFTENFILVLSHDEVVHLKKSLLLKMPGDLWQKFANLKLLYGYMWSHPGKKLLFMGGELAMYDEWNQSESLPWFLIEKTEHKAIFNFLKDLNKLYKTYPEMYELDFNENGFQWIDCNDSENSVISFIRKDSKGNYLIFIFNFTPVIRENYKIGVPEKCLYKEIFNSDSEYYNGTNTGNLGEKLPIKESFHNFNYSLVVTLPPLGFIIFKPVK